MAVENMNAVQSLVQANARPMSAASTLQTGILALMMIMMFTMDGRFQSLFGMVGHFFKGLRRSLPELCGIAICFVMTCYVCSLDMDPPGLDATQKLVREFWPIMKDPDTLLAIHGMLRCIILVSVWYRARRSWPVPASFLHFSALSLLAQVHQYTQAEFGLEGPFAGNSKMAMVILNLVMTLAIARKHKLETGERLYPLAMLSVVLVTSYVCSANFLTIAPEVGSNVVFSFAIFMDAAATFHLAVFVCQSASLGELGNSQADGLMLVILLQKVVKGYYFLDGFGLLPNSTLESVGAEPPSTKEFGVGSPMQLIAAAQIANIAFATLASVAFFLGRYLAQDDKAVQVPANLQTDEDRAQRTAAMQARAAQRATPAPPPVPVGKLSTIVF